MGRARVATAYALWRERNSSDASRSKDNYVFFMRSNCNNYIRIRIRTAKEPFYNKDYYQ